MHGFDVHLIAVLNVHTLCKDDFKFLPSGNLDYNRATLTYMFGFASNDPITLNLIKLPESILQFVWA